MKKDKSIECTFEKMQKFCTGCALCYDICPAKAIDMIPNRKGFLYPQINESCINCGLCSTKCPEQNVLTHFEKSDYYGAVMKKQSEISHSASGGAFVALSDIILEEHGVIVGALLDENLHVVHRVVVDKVGRDSLCGSKYVQSDIRQVIREVKNRIISGDKVMFSGTPCQVAAIKKSLEGMDSSNLITVEILCHGVPSETIFKDYITALESKYGEIATYCFRDRRLGMHGSNVHIVFASGKELVNNSESNSFDRLYSRGYLMRESCYNCHYSVRERIADISIGDYWGIEKVCNDWNTDNGASLICINSQRGRELWDKASGKMINFKTTYSECKQESITQPVKKPDDLEAFWMKYRKSGYESCVKFYAGYTSISKLYRLWKRIRMLSDAL